MAAFTRGINWMALGAAAVLAAFGGRAAADDGWELATEMGVKGKGGWTTCYTFASTLQERFTRAGGESHLVIYDWSDLFHVHDRHAILVYRGEGGRYWGMDNRSEKPRWLRGTTPAEWAAFWDGDKAVSLVSDRTDPRLAGRTADQNRGRSAGTLLAAGRARPSAG